MTLGLDIDDTITRHPGFFALLSRAFVEAGHRVVIVTMRTDRERAAADLDRLGIAWTVLHTVPRALSAERYWRWKGEVCRAEGVDVFFDDSADVLEHMPDATVPFLALDLRRHPVHLLREFADGEE
ncbi:MAG: hypothetical protein ACK4YP_17380 [Myxococcota bacterium]